jgi:predicted  nucleic acid-binding Zn-ribbon protein
MAGDGIVTDAAQATRLLELGETDLEIARLTKELDELPVKTELLRLRHKLKELDALREKADAFVAAAEREIKRLEDEIAQIDAHIAAAKAQASSAGSNHKEIQNLLREADALGRQKDKKETELVDAMERAEAGETKRSEIDALITKAREKEARLVEEYRAAGGELKRRIAQAEARRASLASSLDAALLARYEAVRDAKHGIGVGRFDEGRCSVCRIDLPADKAQALQSGGPIGECPNCHRILVVERAE